MINIADDLERVASPGEAPSDIQRKERDPDDRSDWSDGRYSGNLIADCEAVERRRQAEAILAQEDTSGMSGDQLRQRYCEIVQELARESEYLEVTDSDRLEHIAKSEPTIADCMHSMMNASEQFFAATDAMFAPLHNKGDTK